MPKYQYRCEVCGDFEVYQHFEDEPLTTHTACGSPVRRVYSIGAVIWPNRTIIADSDKAAEWDRKHPTRRAV